MTQNSLLVLVLLPFILFYTFSFSSNYKNRVWRNEVMVKKQERQERNKKEGLTMTQYNL